MTKTLQAVNEIIVEGYLKAILYDNGIIEIFWDESIELVEVKHLQKMQETVAVLGKGKKIPLLFAPHDFVHINTEGQKYASSEEGVTYTAAVAVLMHNLAMRILMNFFIRTTKIKVPTKGFPNREEAILWLEKFSSKK
ncbi:MAG: hypothetical protein ACK5B9_05765 [Flavobacteriia bacterium]|jgi:hypothetical protein